MQNRQSFATATMIIACALVLSGMGFCARMSVRYFLPYLLQSLMAAEGIQAAAGEQPENQARQGWLAFLEVLSGDQSKFEPAVRQLEQGVAASPADIHNLYTLGRAYFY